MSRLGLSNDKGVVFTCKLAKCFRFFTWNVNRTLSCKLDVIQVKHLVIKGLQRTLRESNQTHRNIEGR